jgi:hypothetical protein
MTDNARMEEEGEDEAGGCAGRGDDGRESVSSTSITDEARKDDGRRDVVGVDVGKCSIGVLPSDVGRLKFAEINTRICQHE